MSEKTPSNEVYMYDDITPKKMERAKRTGERVAELYGIERDRIMNPSDRPSYDEVVAGTKGTSLFRHSDIKEKIERDEKVQKLAGPSARRQAQSEARELDLNLEEMDRVNDMWNDADEENSLREVIRTNGDSLGSRSPERTVTKHEYATGGKHMGGWATKPNIGGSTYSHKQGEEASVSRVVSAKKGRDGHANGNVYGAEIETHTFTAPNQERAQQLIGSLLDKRHAEAVKEEGEHEVRMAKVKLDIHNSRMRQESRQIKGKEAA